MSENEGGWLKVNVEAKIYIKYTWQDHEFQHNETLNKQTHIIGKAI